MNSVAPNNRAEVRKKVREFLEARPLGKRTYQLWVRINAYDDSALVDLASVVVGAPDGIVLPKIDGPDDIGSFRSCGGKLGTILARAESI
jgi:citrate lyase subunit beta/citryl-CoA lyase